MVERAIHEREAKAITRNNRHVIMAYAALWVLTLIFVGFMWTRQRQLSDQITTLKRELDEATRDD